VLSKQAALVRLVVDKSLHAYGDKWVAIVVMMAVHMCVDQDVGIGLQLVQEMQLTFDLGEKLAPKMHRHGGQASAEHADHVVLERLDGLISKVATMVIGGDKFVCHLGKFNFLSKIAGCAACALMLSLLPTMCLWMMALT
jgi:hypothetical protein